MKTRLAIVYNGNMEQSASQEQAKDLAELKKQHAVLEERMNTLQSDLQGTLERFRADMARRDTEAGKRENRLLITMIVVVGVATAVLGVLITAQ